jgi:hypothetical protein
VGAINNNIPGWFIMDRFRRAYQSKAFAGTGCVRSRSSRRATGDVAINAVNPVAEPSSAAIVRLSIGLVVENPMYRGTLSRRMEALSSRYLLPSVRDPAILGRED